MPIELAEKVLSYLDVNSLCAAAQCCQKWRDLANRDTIWSDNKENCVIFQCTMYVGYLGMHFVNGRTM